MESYSISEWFLYTEPFARTSYVVLCDIVWLRPSHEQTCPGKLILINVALGGCSKIHERGSHHEVVFLGGLSAHLSESALMLPNRTKLTSLTLP